MLLCGIVAEYNPFHRGHALHLAETRRNLGDDAALICAMSGDFVQRGGAAVYDKHVRAEAAVRCGADLVLELPLPWALASAEGFARGAVGLLRSAGAEALSFGSESGDAAALDGTAALLLRPELDALLRRGLDEGLSYAAARQRAAETLARRALPELRNPNDILGVEYCKALRLQGADVRLLAIPRQGAGHDSPAEDALPSASLLRQKLAAGENIDALLPPDAAAVFAAARAEGRGPVLPGALDAALLSRLRALTAEDFERAPDVSEGLEQRLLRCVEEPTLASAAEAAASKRYPMARVRRCLLAAALGLRKEDAAGTPPYLRVLAAGPRGREVLAALRGTSLLPIITKPAAARELPDHAARIFELTAAASDLYALGCPDPSQRRAGRDWRAAPVML